MLTIGICAYNEEKNIGRILNNIINQEINQSFEVLVVCSGCIDRTVDIARYFAKIDPRIHVIVEQQRLGKPSAINKILTNAKGSNICFLSADTLPQKGCFNFLINHLEASNKIGLVCGRPTPLNKKTLEIDRLIRLLWGFHHYVFEQLSQQGLAKHASEIFIVRKKAIAELPLGIVNDDAYIAVTAKKKGWTVEYEPLAGVFIIGPQNFRDYLIQRYRVIFGHIQLKKTTGSNSQYLPYLFFNYPKTALKLIIWLFTRYPLHTLLIFLFMESVSAGLGILESLKRKSHVHWTTSASTKLFS